jgi:hypothetical protein
MVGGGQGTRTLIPTAYWPAVPAPGQSLIVPPIVAARCTAFQVASSKLTSSGRQAVDKIVETSLFHITCVRSVWSPSPARACPPMREACQPQIHPSIHPQAIRTNIQ